tara:strand:+ start:79 stop:1626 length:1548 start_codon:yes stop_codon:yes gene_type:complete
MPDIKRNFLRGKMNKDHDERLVADGEYRDAMNIQISTSDDSNIGTAQNILGNRLIATNVSSVLDDNSICIGSIADEKNNKLYYFVNDRGEELITNRNFLSQTNWYLGGGVSFNAAGNSGPNAYTALISTAGDGSAQPFAGFFHRIDCMGGKKYTVSIGISDVDMGGDSLNKSHLMQFYVQGDHDNGGNNSYRPHGHIYCEDKPGVTYYHATFTMDVTQNNGSTKMRAYLQMTRGDSYAKSVRISHPSVIEFPNNYIIQYDTERDRDVSLYGYPNTVSPMHDATFVFVDINGEVLKFVDNNRITGINIIDDMLFWTDGYSEPKKINIPRSIEGTVQNGLIPTKVVNPAQPDAHMQDLVTEEHVTVIRRSPVSMIDVQGVTFRDKFKQYHAYIQISDTNQNPNDIINSSKGNIPNFTSIKAGDTFRAKLTNPGGTQLPVELEWKNGDEVVLKEYNVAGNPDGVPLTEYRIKGTISNWAENNFTTVNPLINKNGDLLQGTTGHPYNTGQPLHWTIGNW